MRVLSIWVVFNIFEMGLGQSHYIRDKSALVSTSMRHSLTTLETNTHFRPYCLIIFEIRHITSIANLFINRRIICCANYSYSRIGHSIVEQPFTLEIY